MKSKFSKVVLTVAAAALIANAVLGLMYFQQQRERELLSSQLAAARDSLAGYGNISSLEEQLGELASEQPNQARFTRALSALERRVEEHDESLDELEGRLKQGTFAPIQIGGQFIEVDTTDFAKIQYDRLCERISASPDTRGG